MADHRRSPFHVPRSVTTVVARVIAAAAVAGAPLAPYKIHEHAQKVFQQVSKVVRRRDEAALDMASGDRIRTWRDSVSIGSRLGGETIRITVGREGRTAPTAPPGPSVDQRHVPGDSQRELSDNRRAWELSNQLGRSRGLDRDIS